MNENAFFDDLLLSYLYKKKKASTLEIENKFGDLLDKQNVNNVISNRDNSVSYINLGYLEYDEDKKTLSITSEGKKFVEEKYSKKRS